MDEKSHNLFKGFGLEITLKSPESCLLVKETLTRMGILSKKNKTLYQSAHILHKQGRYVIIHFLELFSLDGKNANISETDIQRRNAIALLLEEWGLIKIVDTTATNLDLTQMHLVKVIPFKEKKDYTLVSKYSIGSH